ncbi:MAG: 4-phosphoerythronate dehydrogenase [Bacteroidales bacterium]|nr:4-phosphoerythronate dehydrogenase [Bacteroidales bacterium]
MKVIADKHIPFLKGLLEPYCKVEYLDPKEITRESISDADALIIRTRTRCNRELLEGTKVKFIATATIGYDHIDTEYCQKNGITWTNAPGCNSGSVMQYVAASLIMLQQKFGFRFSDMTIGVVGYGNVGKKVVQLAENLGMRVLINDPPLARQGLCGLISLNLLLKESDIVTVHTPLNRDGIDKTYHLFDKEIFQTMRPKTFFINTSRGEVVETQALNAMIDSGHIAAAVIDVWENEPEINQELLSKAFIATPHIAGYSTDGKANATIMSIMALNHFYNLGIKEVKLQLPVPENNTISLEFENNNFEKVVGKAILHTYPIQRDHSQLTKEPHNFELFREKYPLRREFMAYTLLSKSNLTNINDCLHKMGFNLKLI